MNAKVVTPLAKWDLVRGVMPTVPNGDFEMDSAGDMRPDWWISRKAGDRLDAEKISLDTGGPSGKYCLRVEPGDDPDGFVFVYGVNGAIKPNTKYRVSVWIKRDDPNGPVFLSASELAGRLLSSTVTNKWEFLQLEAVSTANACRLQLRCFNKSRKTAWFDGIKVEEIP